MRADELIISPCCNPDLGLEAALAAYQPLGFRYFEAFTSWAASALDIAQSPKAYRDLAERYGFSFASMHLPPVDDDRKASLDHAIKAAEFAAALGVKVVLFKATNRPNYIATARTFLDRTESLGLITVVQNHAGSPITTLEDYREVLDGIHDDRLEAVLEVGHFHTAGIPWRKGYTFLEGRIGLVHIKDQVGPVSVPYGTGEIDLPGLFEQLRTAQCRAPVVVEMEVKDAENTLRYLEEAMAYLKQECGVE